MIQITDKQHPSGYYAFAIREGGRKARILLFGTGVFKRAFGIREKVLPGLQKHQRTAGPV